MKSKKIKQKISLHFFNEPEEDLIALTNYFLTRKDTPEDQLLVKYQIGRTRNRIIYKYSTPDGIYFFKKFVNSSFYRKLQDFLRSQRATRIMHTYFFLKKNDIPSYEILLAAIDHSKFLSNPSIIVIKEYQGESILEILLSEISETSKKELFDKLIHLYVKMLKKGVYHRDPNLTNFIVENNKIKLIDLDDVFILPKITKNLLKKNLKKFNRILLLADIRNLHNRINFSNQDRKYIITEIITQFSNKKNADEIWKWLERNTEVNIKDVSSLLNRLALR